MPTTKDSIMNKDFRSPIFKFALRNDLKNDIKFLPTRATVVSTGWDVFCAQEDRKPIILRPGTYVKIPLGFRTMAPDGWWLQLAPRSSTFAKKSLHCLYGVLDGDWFGHTVLAAQYIPDVNSLGQDLILEFGEPIGQLIPFKLEEMNVENISNEEFDKICENKKSARGVLGFGETRGLK
jgi:dUTPase